ncbi:uncharacterized protein cubi_02979 [Cryptosporidium ubiquitum]|uniref:Uncharacterized protein n=1 Tax=Cryptosporidium ubiquitum TaxID=857276 RepID=A0A1J4MLD4_9CRYT|nr:uncharacterized protein cubi_02979 [Cryptosporidium ubiquitum]OII74847.1 hypothetical protein cubi_02979 [Cryptosporidium ubiquitum]
MAFILFGELCAVNLSCDARLRECESEVKSLLKKNSECSSDLDSLKMEISHLSEMILQCERNNITKESHQTISWRVVFNQLKNFSVFFKGLIAASYSNVPKELDSQIKSFYSKIYAYLDPTIEKYYEVYPLISQHIKSYMNKYVNLLGPYIEYVNIYSEFINEKLDKYVARIESYEPNVAGTIPKNLHDRIFYILCAVFALYVVLESIFIVLKLIFRCFGIRCNSSTNKKAVKSPSSKSTPSNRRK